mgnify:CR=1 FL=1
MNAIPNQRGQLRISLQYFVFMRQQLLIHFCKVHAILIARIAPIQDVPVSIIQKSVGVFHGEIIGIFKRYCLGRSIYDFDKAVFVIPDFTFSGFLNFQQMAAAIVDLACKGTVYVRINVNAALFAASHLPRHTSFSIPESLPIPFYSIPRYSLHLEYGA